MKKGNGEIEKLFEAVRQLESCGSKTFNWWCRVTPRLTMVVTTLVTAKRDSQNDNLKSPLNKGNNDGDASEETNTNNEIKLDNTSENAKTVPQKTEVQKPKQPQIDWQSYPYQSRDRAHLENRANKVKERIEVVTIPVPQVVTLVVPQERSQGPE